MYIKKRLKNNSQKNLKYAYYFCFKVCKKPYYYVYILFVYLKLNFKVESLKYFNNYSFAIFFILKYTQI